jgi:uncharacterized damage-inducible protein DinB
MAEGALARTAERDRIVDHLKRAFEGEAWHGPSVLEALEGVTWKQALEKPIPGAHSIWELVHHITTWEDVVRRRLLGGTPDVPSEVDWPPIRDESKEGWAKALENLKAGHAQLRKVAAQVEDADLDTSPTGKTSTRYVLLHGAVQHDLYHAGQISILKKA